MSDRLDAAALDQLFRTARTRYAWVKETLPEALIRELYDLVALGPTSANSSPARYVFVTSAEGRAKIGPLMSEGNQKALAAPCIAVIGYDLDFPEHMERLFPHNLTAKHWFGPGPDAPQRLDAAFRNGSLSGAYLILAARVLGLDCGPMSGFDVEGTTKAFFPDTNIRANFLCAIGHGADTPFPRSPRLTFEEAARFA